MAALTWLGPCFLVTILVPLTVGLGARGNRRLRIAGCASAALCAILALSSLRTMAWGFAAGRDRAYHDADFTRLVAGCRAIQLAALTESRDPASVYVQKGDAFYSKLPPEILKFNPLRVLAGRRGAVVQMDGGGPAAHEGFFVPLVPLTDGPDVFGSSNALQVLSRNPPVFRYSVYDCRSLPYE